VSSGLSARTGGNPLPPFGANLSHSSMISPPFGGNCRGRCRMTRHALLTVPAEYGSRSARNNCTISLTRVALGWNEGKVANISNKHLILISCIFGFSFSAFF
jgi:hypothetical protein